MPSRLRSCGGTWPWRRSVRNHPARGVGHGHVADARDRDAPSVGGTAPAVERALVLEHLTTSASPRGRVPCREMGSPAPSARATSRMWSQANESGHEVEAPAIHPRQNTPYPQRAPPAIPVHRATSSATVGAVEVASIGSVGGPPSRVLETCPGRPLRRPRRRAAMVHRRSPFQPHRGPTGTRHRLRCCFPFVADGGGIRPASVCEEVEGTTRGQRDPRAGKSAAQRKIVVATAIRGSGRVVTRWRGVPRRGKLAHATDVVTVGDGELELRSRDGSARRV